MSLVFQMISAGNGLSSNSGAGATTTAAASAEGTGSLLPFAQALIQKMTGNVDTTTTLVASNVSDPLTLLQGLLNQLQLTGEVKEDSTSQDKDIISELTKDIEKLDESIENDPTLLAALQGWLLQVSALLTNNVPQENQADTASTLSPLAQNPETLRFAVQDDLNRLVTIIKDAAASGNEELTTKGLTVLNNFTDIMSQSAAVSTVSTEKPKEVVNQNQRAIDNLVVKSDKNTSTNVTAPSESSSNNSDLSSALQNKVKAIGDVKVVTDEEAPSDFVIPTDQNEVVTAGQLLMRSGITAPLKSETPQVPIQHFAKEMTGLITSKLEIVKKGGIAEATISLFPENLGQVDVKITMQNGHLVAQFLTEHASTKDLLEQQMVQLRVALQSQGVQVEKLEVSQNNTPLQSQMQQEGRQSSAGGQQSDKRSNHREEASTDAVNAAELSGEWQDWLENGGSEDPNSTISFSAKA